MELPLGPAHVTLPVWVLAATVGIATASAVPPAYLLGRLHPLSRSGLWLLRLAAAALTFLSLLLSPILAQFYVYATIPRVRSYMVVICFGNPHRNTDFAYLLPPFFVLTAFLASRHTSRHRHPSAALTPGNGSAGA